MRTRQFYVPRIDFWNWALISPNFVKVQYERARLSYVETEDALANLDDDVSKIEQEIRGQWAAGSVNVMRAFESRLKEVRQERKRISFVQLKLRGVMDRMYAHLNEGVRSHV